MPWWIIGKGFYGSCPLPFAEVLYPREIISHGCETSLTFIWPVSHNMQVLSYLKDDWTYCFSFVSRGLGQNIQVHIYQVNK